jgi:hypothetical protein
LISKISTEMKADVLCSAVFHPIVKLLVVAKVEALLLEFPLQVPISLGDKQKSGISALNGGDHIDPILRRGP